MRPWARWLRWKWKAWRRVDPVARALQASCNDGAAWAFSELEELLKRPDIQVDHMEPLTRASRVFLVETTDGLRFLWKAGEALAAREEAAYRLDRRLGHFALVPPVRMRELNGTKGALRFYLGQARPAYLDPRSSYVLQTPERDNYSRLALLDCLLGNRDRHAGNWLLTPAGTVIPIDHGMAFPRQNGPQRFSAYDFHLHAALASNQRESLERMLSQWDEVRAELLPLLGEEAVNALFERIHKMLEHNGTYAWHAGANLQGARLVSVRDTFEATFGCRTGLDASRPEHGIHLTQIDDYQEILEHIEVHRYYLGLERQSEVTLPEAAASWYDGVYLPAVEAIEQTGLRAEFPRSTLADLYLWLTYHREKIRAQKGWMPSDRFVALHLAERFSDRPFRRVWKTLKRGVRAAIEAACDSPRPPEMATRSVGE
jgi:hypothetical protein